jgi:ferredoxin
VDAVAPLWRQRREPCKRRLTRWETTSTLAGMDADGSLAATNQKFSVRSGVTVQVDHDICVGFGECVSAAPAVFALDDQSLAIVLDPDAVDLALLQAAADVCPVSAIILMNGDQAAP